jgi:leader peptidase (prepilin peptidase)/N-methyltransferase
MIELLATLFAALAGLAFGSFLNVCLSRWPEGESVVKPRSHCRTCNRTLTWWENIPLLSWLALRGRCRTCKSPIGWRYPLVEAAMGLLWGLAFGRFVARLLGDVPAGALALYAVECAGTMILLWLLVALAALDAEHLWLPDWLTIPGAVLGLLAEGLRAWLQNNGITSPSPLEAVLVRALEAIGVAALILLIRALYGLLRRREGLGLGDAKLLALLAAWLGLPGAALAFVVGVVLGTLAALVALLQPRRDNQEPWAQMKLPLGTFLCLGGILSNLWGQPIIKIYLKWAGF